MYKIYFLLWLAVENIVDSSSQYEVSMSTLKIHLLKRYGWVSPVVKISSKGIFCLNLETIDWVESESKATRVLVEQVLIVA